MLLYLTLPVFDFQGGILNPAVFIWDLIVFILDPTVFIWDIVVFLMDPAVFVFSGIPGAITQAAAPVINKPCPSKPSFSPAFRSRCIYRKAEPALPGCSEM